MPQHSFRTFIAWYTAILGGFSTLFLGMLVLMAYAQGGTLTLNIDYFGEATVELVVFAVVCGTVPFGLYTLDGYLQTDD